MSEIEQTDINDPHYQKVMNKGTPVTNYSLLAEKIHKAEEGAVFKFRGLKRNITNIHRGLKLRNLKKSVDYQLNFSCDDSDPTEGTFFITVLDGAIKD